MPRRDQRQAQPLCITGVVVICLAGQQTVRAHGKDLFKQAAACTADDGQPPHRFAGVGKFDLHRQADVRCIAAGGQLLLCLAGQLRHRDGFNAAHPAAALGKGLRVLHAKDTGQHLVDAAGSRIQIGMHADGRDARPHQLERHILRPQLFERVKDDRVVRHNGFAVLRGGLCHHLRGDVQRDQHPGHFPGAVHQQTGVVPAFCQFQRRDALHGFIELLYGRHSPVPSFKSRSISSASGVPSGTPRRIRGSLAFCQAA